LFSLLSSIFENSLWALELLVPRISPRVEPMLIMMTSMMLLLTSVRESLLNVLPRYLEKGCCQDPDHMKNRAEPDFGKKLEEGVFAVRRNIKNSAFKHGYKRCVTLSAWGKVRKLESLWSDAVHLSDEGYKTLASSIVEAMEELKTKRKGDNLVDAPASKKPRVEAGEANNRGQTGSTRGQQCPRGHLFTRGREGGRGGRGYTDGYRFYSQPGQGWNALPARRGAGGRPGGRPRGFVSRGRGGPYF
jgi:hypothetical protein